MSILNQIEDKLYKANFKTELLRQQFYLAVHATLTKNKDVPRFYALSKQLNEEELDQLFSNLLFSDSNFIAENTNKLLSHLHISTKQLNSLSQEEKDEIINTVEYVLLNGWGKGIILYDNLRIKPSNSCDLLNYLNCEMHPLNF